MRLNISPVSVVVQDFFGSSPTPYTQTLQYFNSSRTSQRVHHFFKSFVEDLLSRSILAHPSTSHCSLVEPDEFLVANSYPNLNWCQKPRQQWNSPCLWSLGQKTILRHEILDIRKSLTDSSIPNLTPTSQTVEIYSVGRGRIEVVPTRHIALGKRPWEWRRQESWSDIYNADNGVRTGA